MHFILTAVAMWSVSALVLGSSLHSAFLSIPQAEYNALYSLYDSTDGVHWRWRNPDYGAIWDFNNSTDPCTSHWQGITCSKEPDADNIFHITELSLSAYDLVGSLPVTIGDLSALAVLELNENFINGTLPTSVGNLLNLTEINLGGNFLRGSLPTILEQLQRLRYVDIDRNFFSGLLAPVLCNLPNLQRFYASENLFTGTIPDCISAVMNLRELDLSRNSLEGSLPIVLTTLRNLTILSLYDNLLSGTIPDEIGQLTALEILNLGKNSFYGTIPAGMSALTSLMQLDMPYSNFNGSIPSYLSTLSSLRILNLGVNKLTGGVPEEFAALKQLEGLVLWTNELSGPLPDIVCALSNLTYLDLGSNRFTGTINPCYGDFDHILRLYMDSNHLTGDMPSSLCNLHTVRDLYLTENQLTGALPDCTSANWPNMGTLYLYQNFFSGTIPSQWTALPNAQYVDVGANYLDGTIPAFVLDESPLQYFYVNHNYLFGIIPENIDRLPHIRELLFQVNVLTGSLPSALPHLFNLSVLSVNFNKLSGNLEGLFNATSQHYFTTLKINDNQFTGPLPDDIFRLPSLSVVVAAGNCLQTLLPKTICNASNLVTLSLDGIHTAKPCRREILPGISTAYAAQDEDKHRLMECLFYLPNLKTLHLSGNSITGTLPDVDVLSTRLIDFDASDNGLNGTIPETFQQKIWYRMDLSYNSLSGTLRSDFATIPAGTAFADDDLIPTNITFQMALNTYDLSLENNRLSGKLPDVVVNMLNISVLGSNMFSCALDHSDLPQHDRGSNTYNCGSTSFDIPFYTWLGVATSSVVLIVSLWWFVHVRPDIQEAVQAGQNWLQVASGRTQPGDRDLRLVYTALLNHVCVELCRTALLCTVYILLVLLPAYVALSTYYGTMTYQYTYSVAAIFLSGTVPAIIKLVLIFGLVSLFVMCMVQMEATTRNHTQAAHSVYHSTSQTSTDVGSADSSAGSWLRNASIYTAFGLANIIVVAGVNFCFVYAVLYMSSELLLLAQIGVAVFKFLWNGFGAPYLVRRTRTMLYGEHVHKLSSQLETRFIMLQVLNALLNNIVIPCVVVAVVSPSCYYNLFFPEPDVVTPFTYVLCSNYEAGRCTSSELVLTNNSYVPSYTYSYQCSSSMITSYAPAFVVLCIIAGFIVPVAEVMACYLHSAHPPSSAIYRLADYSMSSILKPVVQDSAPIVRVRHFVKVNRLIVALTGYLAILLTFGAIFPPVAACLMLTMLVVVRGSQLKIGRFLAAALDNKRQDAVDAVEKEVRRAGLVSVLWRSSWLLVTVSCLFYALFLFDTLGDAVGLRKAYWVLIVMPLMPTAIYAGYQATLRWCSPAVTQRGESTAPPHFVELASRQTEPQIALHDVENPSVVETVNSLHARISDHA